MPSAPDVVSVLVSVAIFTYVAVRTATLAITIDEALTWTWHATGTWQDIVLLRTPGEPDNNHVLLTLLAKLAVACFGLSEFTLRLPTLLGFALFLGGINAVLRRIVPGWMHVLGVCALGLNPYLVDYFSIARGYGLGLATAGVAALLAAMADAPRHVHAGATRKMDAAGRDMMLATRSWIAERPRSAPVHLRVFWPLAPSGEFYRQAFGLEGSLQPLKVDDRPGFDGPADLY